MLEKKNWFWNFSPIIPNSLPKQTYFGIGFGTDSLYSFACDGINAICFVHRLIC